MDKHAPAPHIRFHIPDWELEFTYARSSGPGGQNVNKVNSKAVLRWNVRASAALSDPVRARFLALFASRLTLGGDVVLSSDRYRDQIRNREDCVQKLEAMVREAATPPKPRKKTRPTRSSKRKRMDGKRAHGDKKKLRGRVHD